jgi:mitogen-activated protein kinase 1/3
MLLFNPEKRFTAEECLAHKYFKGLHDITKELKSEVFDWTFDRFKPKN